MIKEWARHKPMLSDIYSYFDKIPNTDRVEKLRNAFKLRGINIDAEHFDNFLAIKYMRNAYVHGEWKETERTYVVQRGFPNSLMSFDQTHFTKMKESHRHVMNCLGKAHAFNAVLEARFAQNAPTR